MTDTVPYEFDLDNDPAAREAVRLYCDRVEPDNPALARRLRIRVPVSGSKALSVIWLTSGTCLTMTM